MAAKRRGELPLAPCSRLFGCYDPEARDGVSGSLRATRWLAGPSGSIYGGVLAWVLDTVFTGALSSVLPPGTICSPLDLKVQFLHPVWPDHRGLRASAQVTHHSKRFATVTGQIADDDGIVVAVGMSSFVIVDGKTWSSLTLADETPAPTPYPAGSKSESGSERDQGPWSAPRSTPLLRP